MMDYSYLNQTGFDTNCGIPGMDGALANCNLPGSYDLGRCGGGVSQPYTYNTMRPFSTSSASGMQPPGAASCSMGMMPRPREHHQAPMFPSGELAAGLPSARLMVQGTDIHSSFHYIRFRRRVLIYKLYI